MTGRSKRDTKRPNYREIPPDDDPPPSPPDDQPQPSPSSDSPAKGRGKARKRSPAASKAGSATTKSGAAGQAAALGKKPTGKVVAGKDAAAQKKPAVKAPKNPSGKKSGDNKSGRLSDSEDDAPLKKARGRKRKAVPDSDDENVEGTELSAKRPLEGFSPAYNTTLQGLNDAWIKHLQLFHIENDTKYVRKRSWLLNHDCVNNANLTAGCITPRRSLTFSSQAPSAMYHLSIEPPPTPNRLRTGQLFCRLPAMKRRTFLKTPSKSQRKRRQMAGWLR